MSSLPDWKGRRFRQSRGREGIRGRERRATIEHLSNFTPDAEVNSRFRTSSGSSVMARAEASPGWPPSGKRHRPSNHALGSMILLLTRLPPSLNPAGLWEHSRSGSGRRGPSVELGLVANHIGEQHLVEPGKPARSRSLPSTELRYVFPRARQLR